MSTTNPTIRIVGVPPGEAPFWVREQWVGLELPLTRHSAPGTFYSFGAVSGPRTCLAQLWGIIRARAERVRGYVVHSVEAVDILASSSPAAAAWWRENVPHLIGPRRYLVFHEHACEMIGV